MENYDVVILGGGFSGLSAALNLVRNGKKVHIIEKSNKLGGLASTFSFSKEIEVEKFYHHWFNNDNNNSSVLPDKLLIELQKSLEMRYGENPHQKAAFYKSSDNRIGVADAIQLQGKELSYNNINDADAAFELISEFTKPTVAIIKHANPCGVAENTNINLAWKNALQTDPVSAFGGIVALNRELTLKLANQMKSLFLE